MSKEIGIEVSVDQLATFVQKFTEDAVFREKLKEKPHEALKGIGIDVPENVKINIPEEYFREPELLKKKVAQAPVVLCWLAE